MNDLKYPIGGFAPGSYLCNCVTCNSQFQGDKRAVQCELCALRQAVVYHEFNANSLRLQYKEANDELLASGNSAQI